MVQSIVGHERIQAFFTYAEVPGLNIVTKPPQAPPTAISIDSSTFRWRGRAPNLSEASFGKGGKGGKGKMRSSVSKKASRGVGEMGVGRAHGANAVAKSNSLLPSSSGGSGGNNPPVLEKGGVPTLQHVSLSLEAGSLTAIVGECGAGKSTLLSAILGELPTVVPDASATTSTRNEGNAAAASELNGRGVISGSRDKSGRSGYQLLLNDEDRHDTAEGAVGVSGWESYYELSRGEQRSRVRIFANDGNEVDNESNTSAGDSYDCRCVLGGLRRRIGYAAQKPWIRNATVRDNILIGAPFDPDR